MEKKLPGIFVNKIDKKLDNNKSVYYGTREEKEVLKEEKSENKKADTFSLNIKQKIKQIFQSEHYIYKMDVTITMKDKKLDKRIVGYNETDLITFENELIPISEIVDIEIKEAQ